MKQWRVLTNDKILKQKVLLLKNHFLSTEMGILTILSGVSRNTKKDNNSGNV